MESRDSIRKESDYLYTTRQARRRYKADRRSAVTIPRSFRAWTRKTYTARACTGKLRAIVVGRQATRVPIG